MPPIILALFGLGGSSVGEVVGGLTLGATLRTAGAWILRQGANQVGKQALKQVAGQVGKQVLKKGAGQISKQVSKKATKKVTERITTKATQIGAKKQNSIWVKETQSAQPPKTKIETPNNETLHHEQHLKGAYNKFQATRNSLPNKPLW